MRNGWMLAILVSSVASCDGCGRITRTGDAEAEGSSSCAAALQEATDHIEQLVAEGGTWSHPAGFAPIALERPATAPPTAPLMVLTPEDAAVDGSRFPTTTEALRGDGGALRHLVRAKLARAGGDDGEESPQLILEVGGEVTWERVVVTTEMLAALDVKRVALAFHGASVVKEPSVDDDEAAAIPTDAESAAAMLSSEVPGPLEACEIEIDPKPDLPAHATLAQVAAKLPGCGCDVEPAVIERWAWTALGRHQSAAHAMVTIALDGGEGKGQVVAQPAATPWSKAHVALVDAAGDSPLKLTSR